MGQRGRGGLHLFIFSKMTYQPNLGTQSQSGENPKYLLSRHPMPFFLCENIWRFFGGWEHNSIQIERSSQKSRPSVFQCQSVQTHLNPSQASLAALLETAGKDHHHQREV